MYQYKTRTIGQGQEYKVYDYAQDPLGQLGETPDGRVFRFVKLTGNANPGNIVAEDVSQQGLESAAVRTGLPSQYLEIKFNNVAANTRLFEKDELQLFRDDASLGGRLYRVQTNPEVMNDGAAAADVTVNITVVDLSAPDGATIPSDYSQTTANKAVVYATNYRGGQVLALNALPAADSGKSRRIIGVVQSKIAASANAPRYAWVQIGGPAMVTKKSATAAGSGQQVVASLTAAAAGKVEPVAAGGAQFPVGTVRYAAAAADDYVLVDLDIQS